LAIYYIIEGTIYQAPTLGHILSNRLLTALYHINQAFDKAQAAARFHPIEGYHWDTDEPGMEKAREELKNAARKYRDRPFTAEDQRLRRESQQRVEQLLVQSFTEDPKRKQQEADTPMKKIKQ
jgi:mediator of RNA polymerase II transcription subunit 6